jgi:hypothetical protein
MMRLRYATTSSPMDKDGKRFWIYRERNADRDWFLQGVFS